MISTQMSLLYIAALNVKTYCFYFESFSLLFCGIYFMYTQLPSKVSDVNQKPEKILFILVTAF